MPEGTILNATGTLSGSRPAIDRQLQLLLEALPVAAYMCDPQGLIIYFNREAEAVWGRAPRLNDAADRWCGSFRLFSAVDGTPLKHEDCWMAKAIQTGQPQNAQEIIVERPDGRQMTVLAHANPLHDDEGVLVGAVNVMIDISDRKAAEVTQARLGAIVESSDDAIISKTLTGQIISWNSSAERLFGYTPEEAIGQSVTMIIPTERLSEETTILGKIVRGERVEHYETVRVTKDGRPLQISLTSSPVRDGRGRIIGASKVARDITARKEDEVQLRRLHEELRKADRAKNEFLATLAHELRNPLAPIRNLVTMLQLAESPLPHLPAALGAIDRQLTQLTRLIDDLMDIARISKNRLALRKERIDLAEVIQMAVESSRPLFQALDHDLRIDLPAEPILLDADAARLAQAIANLLGNAAKYTERGGQIGIVVTRQEAEATITVRDSGIGIPAEMLGPIFELFTQGSSSPDHAHGGLGIGLHLARQLAEMHGGSLTAESAGPDQGSQFHLHIPIMPMPASVPEPPLVPAPTTPSSHLQILIVDDNRDAADSLAALLAIAGHAVSVVYDGPQALESGSGLAPDVVLLDIGMPGMDGYETARRIRAEPWGRAITIVALTGWGQEEARLRSREAGFDLHMVKPVDPTALIEQLAAMQPTNTT